MIAVGLPHFITQRGRARQAVFLTDSLRRSYLTLLSEQATSNGLRLLAYCLMTNHAHIVAVPATASSMANAFRNVHGRFSQAWNTLHNRTGQVWQNRFYSCPVAEAALERAVAYVENDPVREGLVACAEDFEWSSARAHLRTGSSGPSLGGPSLDMDWWRQHWTPEYWRQRLLHTPESEQAFFPPVT
jgi:putative transposase